METNNRHYAVIDTYRGKVTVRHGDTVVAESRSALNLKEVGASVYDSVLYFPKDDVDMTELAKVENKTTSCPIKGAATYWDPKDETVDPYFAWSYEEAHPMTKKIEGHIAFNPALVTFVLEP